MHIKRAPQSPWMYFLLIYVHTYINSFSLITFWDLGMSYTRTLIHGGPLRSKSHGKVQSETHSCKCLACLLGKMPGNQRQRCSTIPDLEHQGKSLRDDGRERVHAKKRIRLRRIRTVNWYNKHGNLADPIRLNQAAVGSFVSKQLLTASTAGTGCPG